jgi:hypothetical protein
LSYFENEFQDASNLLRNMKKAFYERSFAEAIQKLGIQVSPEIVEIQKEIIEVLTSTEEARQAFITSLGHKDAEYVGNLYQVLRGTHKDFMRAYVDPLSLVNLEIVLVPLPFQTKMYLLAETAKVNTINHFTYLVKALAQSPTVSPHAPRQSSPEIAAAFSHYTPSQLNGFSPPSQHSRTNPLEQLLQDTLEAAISPELEAITTDLSKPLSSHEKVALLERLRHLSIAEMNHLVSEILETGSTTQKAQFVELYDHLKSQAVHHPVHLSSQHSIQGNPVMPHPPPRVHF